MHAFFPEEYVCFSAFTSHENAAPRTREILNVLGGEHFQLQSRERNEFTTRLIPSCKELKRWEAKLLQQTMPL